MWPHKYVDALMLYVLYTVVAQIDYYRKRHPHIHTEPCDMTGTVVLW